MTDQETTFVPRNPHARAERVQLYVSGARHRRLKEFAKHYNLPVTHLLDDILKHHDVNYSHVLKGQSNGED